MFAHSRYSTLGPMAILAAVLALIFFSSARPGPSVAAAPATKSKDPKPAKPAAVPAVYECLSASGPITIDGRADEQAWQLARPIDDFTLPWVREGSRKPETATRARLLWDDDYLYFFADMDDGDLYADIKQQDGPIWLNDVFELFFKPAVDKPGYYEFEISAANTKLDMFIPRRGGGFYDRFKSDGDFDIDSVVQPRGTLNQWNDKDTGWAVEGRIPWKGFERTGGAPTAGDQWKFALCRYDYSVDFEGPALSTNAPMSTKPHPDFHYFEDYASIKFVAPAAAANSTPR